MELSKTYDPNQAEPDIYALWEKSGAFEPDGFGDPYCIIMPPPNANGNLHAGHALTIGVEDILVRYYRMRGRDTIYIPGADHAGFETWTVYERILKEQGKSRFDFSREQLYQQVWDFVSSQRGNMELQLRALGASPSWNDLTFTLDEKVVKNVYRTFQKMWQEGLIYRGERIVNFCTEHQTSFADIEVQYRNEKSKLWSVAYPLSDGSGEITIATTRPETMLGDTAVAVHPKDERYKSLIGKTCRLPLTDREIPIIADSYVDMSYGTGALKITPAHDANDYEVGQRHKLEAISVIGLDGLMVNTPPDFMGLNIEECRQLVLDKLESAGLRRGESDIEHPVGHCYKCGTTIEPMLKEQWFVKVRPLADRAIEVLKHDEISFTPKNAKKTLINYLQGLKDWNISRQIAWGIPIPAFQNIKDPNDWIFNESVDQLEILVDDKIYRREEDTFDTWFSSGQWPAITTDAIDKGKLSRFYPTSVMETGGDLLFPWVARMIMLNLYTTDKVPFRDVYLHGMVLDEKGKKMSKSKGNVVNPMETISKYGSDALRLGLIASRTPGQNQAFSIDRVITGRNLCNKLWNIARYIVGQVVSDNLNNIIGEDNLDIILLKNVIRRKASPFSIADHWIIRQINRASQKISQQIESYRFAEAAETLYHTIWNDLADWYVEASKMQPNLPMLAWILDNCLKMAHPMAPFVTETIWQTLPWHEHMIIKQRWPEDIEYNDISAGQFDKLIELVSEIRFVKTSLPNNQKYSLLCQADSLIRDEAELIQWLAKLETVLEVDEPKGLRLAVDGRRAWLDIPEGDISQHRANLEMRLVEVQQKIDVLEKRLGNQAYLKNAPAKLVTETKEQLSANAKLAEQLKRELEVIDNPGLNLNS